MSGANAFILRKNKLLLIKRRDYPLWVLPGGRIESGESPEKAALRETYEETGFKVKIIKKLRTYTTSTTVRIYLFKCAIVSGRATTSPESKEVKFFDLNKIPQPHDPRINSFMAAHQSNKYKKEPLPSITKSQKLYLLKHYPILSLRYLLTKVGIHLNI